MSLLPHNMKRNCYPLDSLMAFCTSSSLKHPQNKNTPDPNNKSNKPFVSYVHSKLFPECEGFLMKKKKRSIFSSL